MKSKPITDIILKDKIEAWIMANASKESKAKEIIEIAKDFAKDFSLWKDYQVRKELNESCNAEKILDILDENEKNINSLINMYLEEKRLFNKYTNNSI